MFSCSCICRDGKYAGDNSAFKFQSESNAVASRRCCDPPLERAGCDRLGDRISAPEVAKLFLDDLLGVDGAAL